MLLSISFPPVEEYGQSLLHVPVPQSVNKGVQHGGDHCIYHRGHHSSVCRIVGGGLEIHQKEGPIEESDNCQVSTTGREDFVLSPRRGDPEDGVDDMGIRDQGQVRGTTPESAASANILT